MKLLYDTGNVRYYHGDARHLDAIPDDSMHMVITSPPYFNAREEYASWPTYAAYLEDMATVWRECYRVLCDGGRIAVNVPITYGRPNCRNGIGECLPIGADTTTGILAAGHTLRGVVVWSKLGLNSGTGWGSWKSASCPVMVDVAECIIIAHKGNRSRGKGESTIDKETFLKARESVWQIPPVRSWHPAPFPSELPRRLIQLYTFKGDTVLDPFAGSGVTLWEAANAGRMAIGVDLSKEYIDRACGIGVVDAEEKRG